MTAITHHASSINEPVQLTEAAKKHVLAYLSKDEKNKGIRFSVKKTGCSGLSYVIDYVTDASPEDLVQPLTDDYILCLDKKSYPFLKGMQIDYVKEGINFKFVFNNPNQTGQCGCGESFTVQ